MAGEQILLDPTAEGTGTQLDITDPALGYFLLTHEYPTPEPETQWASSADTEGERAAGRRYKNRTITVTVRCVQPTGGTPTVLTIVKGLQQKIAKLYAEGGTYRRVLATGEVITFDIEQATLQVPADKRWLVRQTADITMQFVCRPFGRGPEVDLGDNVETTLPVLIFTDTGIKGDVPARGRLVIDNDDASNAQRLIRWGLQSRDYSSASTAALFYQAEACAMFVASAAAGPAGASGSGSNTAFYGSLPAAPSFSATMFYAGASNTAQTHVGTFRLLARVWAPATNLGTVSLRLSYFATIGGPLIDNPPVSLDSRGAWLLVDLGMVMLPRALPGATQGWLGSIIGNSTVSGDDVYADWIAFVPVDEGSGENVAVDPGVSPQITASGGATIRHDCAVATRSGGYAPPLSSYEGDYLLIPPSGMESRTVRVLIKMARGDASSPGTAACFPDPGIDDLSARLFYAPRYLAVPEP